MEHHEDAEGDIRQPTHKVTPKGKTSSQVQGGNVTRVDPVGSMCPSETGDSLT